MTASRKKKVTIQKREAYALSRLKNYKYTKGIKTGKNSKMTMITTKNISMYVQELKTKILDEASSVCMTLWYYINIKQVLTW